jgi:hypothetical protein
MSDSSASDTSEETDEGSPGRGKPAPLGEVSDDERGQIEQERQERLDPDNRPENAEVDNTQRDFDTEHGEFTDADHDEQLGPFSSDEV